MCEFETRLVAWIDGELDADSSGEMDRHLETCESCSLKAAQYREISLAFVAYCDAAPRPLRSRSRWAMVPVAITMAGAAATILWMIRPAPAALPLPLRMLAAPPAMALVIPPAPAKHIHRPASAVASTPAEQITSEPTIEIAIPAEAIFAPGAFPSGFGFAADLSIRGDGSTDGLRVRPASYLK
jgi:anti-sigma factor RsiW